MKRTLPNAETLPWIEKLRENCLFNTNGLITDIVQNIFNKVVSNDNLQSFAALSCTNAHFYLTSKDKFPGYQLPKFPELMILDAKKQGLEGIIEPSISFNLVSGCPKLALNVERNEGLTLLTVPQGITLNQVIAMAQGANIEVVIDRDEILNQLGDEVVQKTTRVLITNDPVIYTRDKPVADEQDANGEIIKGQETVIREAGFDGLPTLIEYLLVIIHTQRISGKWLYGRNPLTYGRTSTRVNNFSLVVGSSAAGRVRVFSSIFGFEHHGAGGRKE